MPPIISGTQMDAGRGLAAAWSDGTVSRRPHADPERLKVPAQMIDEHPDLARIAPVRLIGHVGSRAEGAFMGETQGQIPAFLGEQLPRAMRYSGISASYQIGAAPGGGTASTAAQANLIATHHNAFAVALYGALALAIVAFCSYRLKETSRLTMTGIDAGGPNMSDSATIRGSERCAKAQG